MSSRRAQTGLGIVEVMIGVVIGMIGTIVVFNVLLLGMQQRATTSSDAMTIQSGSLALFALERDVAQAGFGVARAPSDVMGCEFPVNATYNASLMPVRVLRTAGAPDQLELFIGSSPLLDEPATLDSALTTATQLAFAKSAAGFRDGEWVVATQPGGANRCVLGRLAAVDLATRRAAFGAAAGGSAANATLAVNLGREPRFVRYEVVGDKLVETMPFAAGGVGRSMSMSDGVIDFRVQYGYDGLASAPDGSVDPTEWTDNLPAPTDWSRVLAVRFAILTRGAHYEKERVTPALPVWAGGAFSLDLVRTIGAGPTNDPDGWRHYRYRVYQSAVMLRNQIWSRS